MKNHKIFVVLILSTVLLTACGDSAISEDEARSAILSRPAVTEVQDVKDCSLRNNGTSVCTVRYVAHRRIIERYMCFEKQPSGWEVRHEIAVHSGTRGDLNC